MDVENISSQADEVEALSSIYEQEWTVVSEPSRIYSVCFGGAGRGITLEVSLPAGYPGQCPPLYELQAPWLRGDLRQRLSSQLDTLYLENMGSNILYLWIERVKQFLEEHRGHETLVADVLTAASQRPNESPEPVTVPLPRLQVTHGECIVDRKSVFQGHCAAVTSPQQARQLVALLLENRKIAAAAHNMWAYRIVSGGGGTAAATFQQDCDDDGETHAGARMLHLLEILDVMDVVVVVTRWFGGVLLGPDRFRHINNATRQVLELGGFVLPAADHRKKSKR